MFWGELVTDIPPRLREGGRCSNLPLFCYAVSIKLIKSVGTMDLLLEGCNLLSPPPPPLSSRSQDLILLIDFKSAVSGCFLHRTIC